MGMGVDRDERYPRSFLSMLRLRWPAGNGPVAPVRALARGARAADAITDDPGVVAVTAAHAEAILSPCTPRITCVLRWLS